VTTISLRASSPELASRGKALAASLLARTLNWLEEVGRARAEGSLRRMGTTRATEAAQLRLYAQKWARYDPRMTADLIAAADRHEYAE